MGMQPEQAGHALCSVSQGNGVNYPVCQPLLGDSLSLLLTSVTDKELVRGPEALSSVYVQSQARTGQSIARAGSASSRGGACRLTNWSLKGVVGTLGK